jgi:hypothetical protein
MQPERCQNNHEMLINNLGNFLGVEIQNIDCPARFKISAKTAM